jgi:spermidine/putrescine transport system ATP-binding protein
LAYLEIQGINKFFSGRQVLNNINLSVDKGSFASLLGLSGCGKTTLLRIIAGLETADSGRILLDGRDITSLSTHQRNIGIVFQNYALFPHMTVFENVAYGLKIQKAPTAQIEQRVNAVLQKVKLAHKGPQNVSLLSGGEQQRVALARAIVTEPQIILLDEPLSNLDHSLRLEARLELKRLQNDLGATMIYVTHDQTEALAISDKIALMDRGSIIQDGAPKNIYYHPANYFAADFVGHYNIFDSMAALTSFNYPIDAHKLLCVLPEHLGISKSAEPAAVQVKNILFGGALTEFSLQTGDGSMIKALVPTDTAPDLKTGDQVNITASPKNFKLIDKA